MTSGVHGFISRGRMREGVWIDRHILWTPPGWSFSGQSLGLPGALLLIEISIGFIPVILGWRGRVEFCGLLWFSHLTNNWISQFLFMSCGWYQMAKQTSDPLHTALDLALHLPSPETRRPNLWMAHRWSAGGSTSETMAGGWCSLFPNKQPVWWCYLSRLGSQS